MKKPFSIFLCLMLLSIVASAHAGRTDDAGGHWDSSSGTYHYHHGYPAHDHPNGLCPYDYDDQTGSNSGASHSSSTSASTADTNSAIDDSEIIAWGDGSYEGAYNQGYQYAMEAAAPPDAGLPEAIYAAATYFCKTKSLSGKTSYEVACSSYDDAYEDGYLAANNDINEFINIVYPSGVPKVIDEDQYAESNSQIEYPYDLNDGTYETAYNAGYTRGCALLIELNSEMLPDVNILTGQLSASNRVEGETPLEDYGATFESAYEDGFYQSETDFYSALNDLIVSASYSDESEAINENESQSFSESQIWFPVALMSMLLALVIFIYYKSKEESTRS